MKASANLRPALPPILVTVITEEERAHYDAIREPGWPPIDALIHFNHDLHLQVEMATVKSATVVFPIDDEITIVAEGVSGGCILTVHRADAPNILSDHRNRALHAYKA